MTPKMLPQNIDAEISVLGSMLLDKIALHKSRNLLRKQDFYSEQNSIIFEAILQLDDKADLITVSEKLTGKISPSVIVGLTQDVATSANIEHHIQLVKDKSVARDVIRQQIETLDNAYTTDDIYGLLGRIKDGSFELLQKNIKKEGFDLGKEIVRVLDKMESDKDKDAEFPLGLIGLDRMIRIERGDAMIIGAEPSFGKTSLAMNIAMNQNKVALVCSAEGTKEQLVKRMLSTKGEINSNRIRLGCLDATDWNSATGAIAALQDKRIILSDVTNLRQVRELIIKYSPDMVIIDHLQLIQSLNPVGSRAAIIGELSREVKQIAMENKVAMILLSQLSRIGESKEPTLSRLKESGDIENNADIVLLLWWEWKANNDAERNKQKIICAKNRNGETGYCEVKWQPEYFKYSDIEDNNVPDYKT